MKAIFANSLDVMLCDAARGWDASKPPVNNNHHKVFAKHGFNWKFSNKDEDSANVAHFYKHPAGHEAMHSHDYNIHGQNAGNNYYGIVPKGKRQATEQGESSSDLDKSIGNLK
jgi:hypothetical protein